MKMKRTIIAAQGEVRIYKINAVPVDFEKGKTERNARGDHIISHSERGHHHTLPGGADVMERVSDVPDGMQVFYAILDEPGALTQDAGDAHEKVDLDPGIYEMRIAREYDPFEEQARAVAD